MCAEKMFKDLLDWQKQMEKMIHQIFPQPNRITLPQTSQWYPAMDVFESPEALVVKMEVGGISQDTISVEMENNVLSIRGRRADENKTGEVMYHQMEIPYGEFERKLIFNVPLEETEIDATYEDGFLIVSLPKASPNPATPVSIQII